MQSKSKHINKQRVTGPTTALSSKTIKPLSQEWFFEYYWTDPEQYYKLYGQVGDRTYKGLDECNQILLAMSNE